MLFEEKPHTYKRVKGKSTQKGEGRGESGLLQAG